MTSNTGRHFDIACQTSLELIIQIKNAFACLKVGLERMLWHVFGHKNICNYRVPNYHLGLNLLFKTAMDICFLFIDEKCKVQRDFKSFLGL